MSREEVQYPTYIYTTDGTYRHLEEDEYVHQRLGGKIRVRIALLYSGRWARELGRIMNCGVRVIGGRFVLAPAQPKPRVDYFRKCVRDASIEFQDSDERMNSQIFIL